MKNITLYQNIKIKNQIRTKRLLLGLLEMFIKNLDWLSNPVKSKKVQLNLLRMIYSLKIIRIISLIIVNISQSWVNHKISTLFKINVKRMMDNMNSF